MGVVGENEGRACPFCKLHICTIGFAVKPVKDRGLDGG